jgi:hypothetical protein
MSKTYHETVILRSASTRVIHSFYLSRGGRNIEGPRRCWKNGGHDGIFFPQGDPRARVSFVVGRMVVMTESFFPRAIREQTFHSYLLLKVDRSRDSNWK